MKLNLGCGAHVLDGWVNVDYALGARLVKLPLFRQVNRWFKLFNLQWNDKIVLHDLTKTFPWRAASVDAVYSSHTLEHMTRAQGRAFLTEAVRVLRPGGVVRIVVPDLRAFVDDYIEGRTPADEFLIQLDVLYHDYPSALKQRLAPFIQFPHKCMYDNQRLLAVMEELGLEARVCGPFDSAIPDIRDIEQAGRCERAVIVEGRKRAS